MLVTLFCVFYSIDIFLLFIYGFNLFYLLLMSKIHFSRCTVNEKMPAYYPAVAVQIPIYNEKYVVERIIDGVIAIDYPKDKKIIQVLDDSTDDTLDLSRKIVKKYRDMGYAISLIHRKIRKGQKGGALREGLAKLDCDYVAIFDADFIPDKNILIQTISYFLEDDQLGMVQTRWGHINANYSLLTRAQGIYIDSHFIIEQVARNSTGLFMNFNGTAGIWRKSCIIDAGNWEDDTLTEDLDLSYRALLKGWKMKYLKDIVNPSELPVQITAFKSQQFRWAKGSIQTFIKLVKHVIISEKRINAKIQALLHLTYYTVHPLLLLNILLSIPALIITKNYFVPYYYYTVSMFALVFNITIFAPPLYFAYSQYKLYKSWGRKLIWIPAAMVVGTGVAVSNTKAFFEAVFGKKSEFIRTPKYGIETKDNTWKGKEYKIPFSLLSILELFFALYSITGIGVAFLIGNYFIIPFYVLYTLSFSYVFFTGLIQNLRGKRLKFAYGE